VPRPLKAFAHYPGWIMEVIRRLGSGESIVQLPQSDKGIAVSSVHMFNRARAQFVREATHAGAQHEELKLAEVALDIVGRVVQAGTGQHYIEFVRRGLAILADESRGSRRGMPSELREELSIPGLASDAQREAPQRNEQPADERRKVGAQSFDKHDEQLADLLGIDLDLIIAQGRDRNLSALPDLSGGECAHEPDLYGVMCVKCNAKLS